MLKWPGRPITSAWARGHNMGLQSWAARQARFCHDRDCRQSVRKQSADRLCRIVQDCTRSAVIPVNSLQGYCALIWAKPIDIEGDFVGMAVSDRDFFRFFPADVRLDELDGLACGSLEELRSQVTCERQQILARLDLDRLLS